MPRSAPPARGASSFQLRRPLTFILGPDETLASPSPAPAAGMFGETRRYWERWVRSLAIPFEWQEAVIRAAITLKLCSFDDTGAIIAALTTSIPEAAHSGRNWDYRYCWLRDSYFVVHALNRLGATHHGGYLRYILNVAASSRRRSPLQPVYGISGERRADRSAWSSTAGLPRHGPRAGRQPGLRAGPERRLRRGGASAAQAFFDRAWTTAGDEALRTAGAIGERAATLFDQPDAGLWEYRGRAGCTPSRR
jgi:hypothetical protein